MAMPLGMKKNTTTVASNLAITNLNGSFAVVDVSPDRQRYSRQCVSIFFDANVVIKGKSNAVYRCLYSYRQL